MGRAVTGLLLCAFALPGAVLAQDTAPNLRFGITTGIVANDNRGFDDPSQGSTLELFSTLDFGLTFATPIQQLEITGDITLRGLDGAEENSISSGLVDPNLRLSYGRQARNAQLSVTAFARESETSTLIEEFDGIDLALVNDDATRLSYGFDTSLELRRQAPFGITLSSGFSALRYSDTASTALTDQDRFQIGASFRFDINPALQGTLAATLSTFEDDGTTTGRRDTFSLDGRLQQTLRDGRFGLRANITDTEEGERYTLSVERTIERALWNVGGTFGLTQNVNGDVSPVGSVDISHTLPNGALSLNLDRSVRAGLNDTEQKTTAVRFNYAQQLNELSSLNMDFSYRENDQTGSGATTSLGTVGVAYQRNLAPGWRMNVGLNHRVNRAASGVKARDNRLSISVRRDLSALR